MDSAQPTYAQLLSELKALILAAHNPDLAKEGCVIQVWHDGEITQQKGGRLLWARDLFTLQAAVPGFSIAMPRPYDEEQGSSYAFVSCGDAAAIHKLMARAAAALSGLRKFIRGVHNPDLARERGMVYQVWNDGEITSQKGGDLLWQRSLHTHYPPLACGFSVVMPAPHRGALGASYAYVTYADALEVRRRMALASGVPDAYGVEEEIAAEEKALAEGTADDPAALIRRIAANNLRKWAAGQRLAAERQPAEENADRC